MIISELDDLDIDTASLKSIKSKIESDVNRAENELAKGDADDAMDALRDARDGLVDLGTTRQGGADHIAGFGSDLCLCLYPFME